MWDPNDTLAAWARDDDVLSWRSFDTFRGVEADPFSGNAFHGDADSDEEDLEELPPVVDKHTARVGVPRQSIEQQKEPLDPRARSRGGNKVLPPDDVALCELPSTSEMVSIREPTPVLPERFSTATPEQPTRLDFGRGYDEANPKNFLGADPLQRSPIQVEPRRAPMTLGDFLAKKNPAQTRQAPQLSAPPLPPPIALSLAPHVDSINTSRLDDLRALERRCEDLVEKDRHMQTVLAKQLHQIEAMDDQLRQQDARFQSQQLELSGLKEQLARVERQNATLQSSLQEKELMQDQHTQLLLQKTNELTALDTKVRSLQIANESCQEQARKATEDKDKVHKDYLQVVYDLGKLQKQINAAAKDTGNTAEKDLIVREIEHLRYEKDQLAAKLKESEVRKSSLLQNTAAVEAQKVRELQTRVRELEDELNRARNGRPLPPPAPTIGSQVAPASLNAYHSPAASYDYLRSSTSTAPSTAPWSPQEQFGVPSLLSGAPSSAQAPKPMTLKDMMNDRRVPPTTAASSSTSLAALGYSAADRRSSGSFDYDQFKAEALARRSTSAVPEYAFSMAPDPTVSAPFATEKQSLLHNSLQKRDLEQQLLKLHVEKEQMEAKLIKVEQTGLKTMSARTEKTRLESRLRDLTLEISHLKLTLR